MIRVRAAGSINCEKNVAEKFFEGLSIFAKEKLQVELEYEDMAKDDDIEAMKREKRMIAENKVETEKHWDIVLGGKGTDVQFLNRELATLKANLDGMTESEAFVFGYAILASHLSSHYCTEEHCVHKIEELSAAAAKYELSGQIPVCSFHEHWNY